MQIWTNKQIELFELFLKKYNLPFDKDKLEYFQEAFVHSSFAYQNQLNFNYEKLEFYGDSLLETVVSTYLFNKCHDLAEGDMTKARIKMVQKDTLAELGKELKFENFIILGSSFNENTISDNIYEDTIEAFCAALYLTFGPEALTSFIYQTIIYKYENNLLPCKEDYKTQFQEKMQRNGKHDIRYLTKEIIDNNNVRSFITKVTCDSILYGEGLGNKKHEAENNAAKNALDKCAA